MDWKQVETRWDRYRGRILQQWSKLTAGDLDEAGGGRAALIARIEERYGVNRAEAEQQVEHWLANAH